MTHNGFVFGNNAGSYDYDNRFNILVTLLERLVDSQDKILDELREIKIATQEAGRTGPITETRMDW